MFSLFKVYRKAKIRNQYNRASHLTWEPICGCDKNTRKDNTQEIQEVSPFSFGIHKHAMDRQDSKTKTHIQLNLQKTSTNEVLPWNSQQNTRRLKYVQTVLTLPLVLV